MCSPGARSSIRYGDSHDPNGSASSAHSNSISDPVPENSKTAVVVVLGFGGTVWSVVSGVGVGGM
jgi:hypothetical protein